jgi:Flp pilus assembly protein TadG
MVTAEFAVALPAFVVVVLAAVCGVAVVTAQLRCADAAAVAARMAARGDRPALVQTVTAATAPRGAELSIAQSAGLVTVSVRARLRLPLLGSLLPAVNVGAHVVEPREPVTGNQP